ncbi:uncharacterized protein C9orf43 homolog isoform X2 [Eleutherodactylus coqui]|uniref:uncharacterized protein C9orf43 homolog isoform X2 n=1 Tax=Eleutherodactylus coqui TaxID=57060 RepID=UPI0034625299
MKTAHFRGHLAMELDETVCSRAVCPHPQCWVTLRRIEHGNPRYRLPPAISRHPSQPEGGLPVLSVTTLRGGRAVHDGSDSHHRMTEERSSEASSTPLYKIYSSTATCSMEKVFFPGMNSYSEIVAPSRRSGSYFSGRKPQRVEILHPSFQDRRSREMTMVWVPNAQHQPPRTEEREKPLKVWIKDFSFTELQGERGAGKKSPPHRTTNKKQTKPPTGGCPLNPALIGSSPSPQTKNCMMTSGILVENRRVVLHDTRDKCLAVPHIGQVYRLDEQRPLRNNMEIDLDRIRNQYYLWKKYIHLARPSHRISPADHRTSDPGRSHKSAAPDLLDQMGLYQYDADSALSYYKSRSSETPTGSVICDTTRSHDSGSRNSPSLAELSQKSWIDEDPSAAAGDPPQPAEMEAKKRAQEDVPGEKMAQSVKATDAADIPPQLPALEQNDVLEAEESAGPNASHDLPEPAEQSTVAPQNPEQRTSSPQPNPPPPSPM